MMHWPAAVASEDAAGDVSPSHPILCRYCGLLQQVPALAAPAVASCAQCHATLRRVQRNSLGRALAFSLTALALLVLACIMPLMQVSTFGIILGADVFSGPRRLDQQGIWELALVVLFTTVAAPLLKLVGTNYVLLSLRKTHPPAHLRRVFAWTAKLGAWSMVEVYLLGVFVAYVKLVDIVHIDVGFAVYALVGLMVATVAADAFLDRQAVWEAMERKGVVAHPVGPFTMPAARDGSVSLLACETCEKVSSVAGQGAHECPRCGSHLHARKPNGIARCWALVAAAAILYIPANLYPVLTVVQMGAGAPSTILGGVEELLAAKMYPLAALVFFASIMVPMLKLVGLVILLVMTQFGRPERLVDRGRLYRIVCVIGRWSMIDIFMISILVALVHFGALVTIAPGIGAVAFAGVVILTIFAAESFDPRLMWDAATSPGRRP
ncbi:paraquat-inducible protein A [Acidisoma silvae]|uniref:Paraquat-inducible protein A n=1 Tax=Acidisoma silvae TaxID=2802396 RepID=A0A964DZB0_9PROT|nr:paraquat-inducible protein A [Acidisoma silvae]MCB8876091.1 paraquat-inducible protein A [Acidisoma silvae]